ncbi:hypothetical protein EDB81DRAFT_161315 [Dactylonectria macrodidyma]|uniref:Uncharacterized protein n=1 Tax=Dactylonectria macrodidyma TaxID=307937 RepID=A0A9P9FQ55_9HYPO|nr:hypothetical protein EDB81DRAFT_161315 [Dactylonectria macrodidyma]
MQVEPLRPLSRPMVLVLSGSHTQPWTTSFEPRTSSLEHLASRTRSSNLPRQAGMEMKMVASRGHATHDKADRRREMSLNYCWRDKPNIHRLMTFALVPGPPCSLVRTLSLFSQSLVHCLLPPVIAHQPFAVLSAHATFPPRNYSMSLIIIVSGRVEVSASAILARSRASRVSPALIDLCIPCPSSRCGMQASVTLVLFVIPRPSKRGQRTG